MSLIDTVFARVREKGERPALYEVRGERLLPISGNELLTRVGRFRAFLRASQVAPGERVGLLAPNSADWVAADLAVIAEGAICVPLYARQAPRELAGMLRDCTPKLVLAADNALAAALAEAWPERCAIATFAEALCCDPLRDLARAAAADDPLTIIYTSGTSGEPKGVVLNHGNVEHMLGVTVREIGKMSRARRGQDRVFHYLPFCFAGSRIMLLSQLHRGNALMISTDLNDLQREMRTAAPHYFLNVPALLERIRNGVGQRLATMPAPIRSLYARALVAATQPATASLADRACLGLARRALFPRIRRLIGPNLEFLVCGSAALGEETQRWFELLGIPVYQVYGLTETTAIATIDDTSQVTPGRVGYAIEGCELRLGECGELLCRGPNVFGGYWNRPEASAEALRDGWLHTGDQAEIDERGSVRIIGRVKEVLVPHSGHNVPPTPLEQRLIEASPAIQQALVLGHGRPYLTALVTGDLDVRELERVRDAVNAGLPHYMRLRAMERVTEPFSAENGLLTANQKLRRKAIEERYRDTIEHMYR